MSACMWLHMKYYHTHTLLTLYMSACVCLSEDGLLLGDADPWAVYVLVV